MRGDEARITFRGSAAPRIKGLSAAFHDVQFQAEVRRAVPLSLKLTRLGGAPMLDGLVRAFAAWSFSIVFDLNPSVYQSMRSRYLIGIVAAGTLLTACDGLKEALTAHVDVVARAGSQELSVNRLGDLLGNAKIQVPVTRETAAIIADIWTGYQQLAYAAAHGDSLNDKKAIDAAIAPIVNAQKLQHFMDSVSKTFKVGLRQRGRVQPGGRRIARRAPHSHRLQESGRSADAAEKDSVRKKAEQVRAQVTAANFADMVKKYSTDPSAGAEQAATSASSPSGGMIAAFRPRPPPSSRARSRSRSRRSSAITSFSVSRTPKRRTTSPRSTRQAAVRIADSTYMAQARRRPRNIQVKDNAPAAMKDAVKEAGEAPQGQHDARDVQGRRAHGCRLPRLARDVPAAAADRAAYSAGAGLDAEAVREAAGGAGAAC